MYELRVLSLLGKPKPLYRKRINVYISPTQKNGTHHHQMPEPINIFLVGSLALFLLGVIGGWLLNKKENVFSRSNLQIAVGILVTIVWVASIAAEILIPTYTVSVLVHGIMGAVVGYLFSDDGITFNIGGE